MFIFILKFTGNTKKKKKIWRNILHLTMFNSRALLPCYAASFKNSFIADFLAS